MDNQTQHAADKVNDELDVGYDEKFENRWRQVELASHGFMLLFILAALAGLLGRGPLSHRTQRSINGLFSIDFEPLVRFGTSAQITVHLPPSRQPAGDPMSTRLFLSSTIVEPLGIQQIIPRPSRAEAADGGAFYAFENASEAGGAMIRVVIKPSSVGPVHIEARLGGDRLSWTQWVLP
jgi:hypothetical protein